jgi:hypothetical protein
MDKVKGRLPQSSTSNSFVISTRIQRNLLSWSSGLHNAMYLLADDMDALYENSKPFSMFLKKRGLNEILRKAKLRLQANHTIVPHVGDQSLHLVGCDLIFDLGMY